ncbi:helix-turn-helix domain-containing protein [Paenibacillus sp. 481]|uniref:helix-turn-helix domain-containing protein n=1 Tax=Paenibacillus sp. 481 TaxID=2835869 RepID=UPI001E651A88|nr:helix-turn-helix transcriptional regulator [Paenibacillus sp. 481]UHA74902.1 helix-turn-helix transcriptional regulator [Paenibacillus sp. 481]
MEFDFQVAQAELRQRLQEELIRRGWRQKEIATVTKLSRSRVSKIFKNTQTIMLPQLHEINYAFELDKHSFYDFFIGECFNEAGRLKPRKTSNFILHCIYAEQYEVVKQIVQLLNEDNNRNKMIETTFKIAEYLFESDKRNYSLPFYDIIIRNGFSRNETLAITYFRRFLILRDLDTAGAGSEALHQLVEYLPLLPDELKFDAYYRILAFYNVVENWPKLLAFAKELKDMAIAEGHYKYVAEGLLYESFAHKGMKNFEKSLQATKEYATHGKHYAWLSKCNEFYISIEMGQTEHIDELMSMLREDTDQLLAVLPVAMEAYLANGLLIDAQQYLEKYKLNIDDLLTRKAPFFLKHKLQFVQAMTQYYLETGQNERCLEYNALALELALKLHNSQRVGAAMLMFQQQENIITLEQKSEFMNIISNEVKSNEKSMYGYADDSFLIRFYRGVFY